MKYTCKMIEDLIPLAAEGLCSEESRAAVEAHIAECESCRKLYQQPVGAAAPVNVQPDETKTFKKVHRTLTKHKWLDRILLVITGLVVCTVAVLFYGQITKKPGFVSFDTLLERQRVKKIARMIAEGDVDGFLPYVSYDGFGYDLYTGGMIGPQECFSASIEPLKMAYLRDFSDTKIKKITAEADYADPPVRFDGEDALSLGQRGMIASAKVDLDNDRGFEVTMGAACDGRYSIHVSAMSAEGAPDSEYYDIINFLSYPDIPENGGWIEKLWLRPRNSESGQDTRYRSISLRFSEPVREQLAANLAAFEQDYRFTSVDISRMQYDLEKHELFWTATLQAEDDKGRAVLLTRFTRDFTGLVPQDAALNTVYTDGCTEELAEKLRTLFPAA